MAEGAEPENIELERFERRERKEFFQRRKRIASTLELYFYVIILIYIVWSQMRGNPKISDIEYLLSYPPFLFSSALFIFSLFSMILASTTPFVGLLAGDLKIGSGSFSFPVKIEIANKYGNSPTDFDGDFSKRGAAIDDNSKLIELYIERSRGEMVSAQKRPNALLFAGFFIAIFGLGVFIYTLPGVAQEVPASDADVARYFWSTGLQFVPRLLMLLFIQVLAGFFLRQYRSSMEDYRYFESILRAREDKYISYSILKENSDRKMMIKLVENLIDAKDSGILTKGQTTAALESLRSETNDLRGLADQLTSLVSQTKGSDTKRPDK
ncbi:hypothetical protein [Bosea sp. (in: a-proteobacteria)]|jgi:hypothetical protein|uniref:hypothetical protein n=1 Tax=Bosea sp. (in: a-proteobacteria) TaxID=1871050 RepID=UPI002DDCAB40|nr:hypothetical protein [Bosea sp. (in: a-proteobacteria)]HEV2510158.1 hypothetical protein [Bosea sp. (in: a-proteobacteria)]